MEIIKRQTDTFWKSEFDWEKIKQVSRPIRERYFQFEILILQDLKIKDNEQVLTFIVMAILKVKFHKEEKQWINYWKRTQKCRNNENWNLVLNYVNQSVTV